MRHAAELKPQGREIGEAFLIYICGVAGVQFEEQPDGWRWIYPHSRRENEPRWHGPFVSKGKAAVNCANYSGE